jgi:hypothetical protein
MNGQTGLMFWQAVLMNEQGAPVKGQTVLL